MFALLTTGTGFRERERDSVGMGAVLRELWADREINCLMALRVRGRAWIWGKRPRERKREKEKEIYCFSPSKLHFILFKFDTLLCSQNEVFKQVWTNSSLTLTLTLFLCLNSLPLLMTLSALSRSTLYTLHSPCWIHLIFLLSLLALTRNIERKERDSK